jgi:hypothetical protein
LFPDNTAGIVTKRVGFQRRVQEYYVIPVVVEDNGYPAQSSTGTLTVRVCACVTEGSLLSCTAEAVFLPMGLSTWAVMAILLCMVILLGKSRLSFRLRSWCRGRVFQNFSSDTLRMRVIMITPQVFISNYSMNSVNAINQNVKVYHFTLGGAEVLTYSNFIKLMSQFEKWPLETVP